MADVSGHAVEFSAVVEGVELSVECAQFVAFATMNATYYVMYV